MRGSRWLAAALLTILIPACAQDRETDAELLFDEMLGGETTAMSTGSNAFELSARNLSNEERRTFEVGDSFFNQNWVTAPASTTARDGLGPTFNALSCSSCHSHDGSCPCKWCKSATLASDHAGPAGSGIGSSLVCWVPSSTTGVDR